MKTKKCPLCNETKTQDNFYMCFDKRKGYSRLGSYCKPCTTIHSRKKNKRHYEENKEKRKEYARNYRKQNKDKVKALGAKFKVKYREELKECYVAEQASKSLKCSTKDIHDNPELMKAYTLNLKIKRKINNYGKE